MRRSFCVNINATHNVDFYSKIHDFKNLYRADKECRKGKEWKNSTNRFGIRRMESLLYLEHLLKTGQYEPGDYNVFEIHEPKRRTIKSIKYHHKIVQRSLCDNVIEPLLEPVLIYDNYACRKGKGTHAALRRTEEFIRKHYREYGVGGYVLKCDVEKYFDSIDHDVLWEMLTKYITDDKVLWLLKLIIDSTDNPGLPLGNQTSQWLSVFFLNGMDHFIKEKLRIKYYLRYMDDFVLIHRDKEYLKYCKREIENYLASLKLELNGKSHVFPLKNGIDFLGFHLYLTSSGKVIKKVRRDSKERVRRKLKKYKELYEKGERTYEQIEQSYGSWRAHASHGNCYFLIKKMDKKFLEIFKGDEMYGTAIKRIAGWRKGKGH